MTRPLALLRPEPGWSASAATARAAGIAVVGHPLFAAEPVDWAAPAGEFDAVLAGSAAAFRLGGAPFEPERPAAELPGDARVVEVLVFGCKASQP